MRSIESLNPSQLKELEADWRAGLIPARTIATKYRLDLDALRLFAKERGWNAPDLRAAIDHATTSALVDRAVAARDGDVTGQRYIGNASETVRKYGQVVADVVEQHQELFKESRSLIAEFMVELRELRGPEVDVAALEGVAALIAEDNPELAKLLTGLPAPVEFAKKLATLDAKADILRKLMQSASSVVDMERKSYALDKPGGGAALGYDEYLDEINGESGGSGTRH